MKRRNENEVKGWREERVVGCCGKGKERIEFRAADHVIDLEVPRKVRPSLFSRIMCKLGSPLVFDISPSYSICSPPSSFTLVKLKQREIIISYVEHIAILCS